MQPFKVQLICTTKAKIIWNLEEKNERIGRFWRQLKESQEWVECRVHFATMGSKIHRKFNVFSFEGVEEIFEGLMGFFGFQLICATKAKKIGLNFFN